MDVLDERTVGPFDISVVRSASAGDLRDWLVERGFAYDDRAEEVLRTTSNAAGVLPPCA